MSESTGPSFLTQLHTLSVVEGFHALRYPTLYPDYYAENQGTQEQGLLDEAVANDTVVRYFKNPNETNQNKSQMFLRYFTPLTNYLFGYKTAVKPASHLDYGRTIACIDDIVADDRVAEFRTVDRFVDMSGSLMSARTILPGALIVRSMIETTTHNVAYENPRRCLKLETFIRKKSKIDPEFPRASFDGEETT